MGANPPPPLSSHAWRNGSASYVSLTLVALTSIRRSVVTSVVVGLRITGIPGFVSVALARVWLFAAVVRATVIGAAVVGAAGVVVELRARVVTQYRCAHASGVAAGVVIAGPRVVRYFGVLSEGYIGIVLLVAARAVSATVDAASAVGVVVELRARIVTQYRCADAGGVTADVAVKNLSAVR